MSEAVRHKDEATGHVKYMDLGEFKNLGYLQEVNRQFLHPRGLALEMIVEDDGSVRFGGVWDYRDDPEGMNFGGKLLEQMTRLAQEPQEEFERHIEARQRNLGYVIQPVELQS